MVKSLLPSIICFATLYSVYADTMLLKNGETLEVDILEVTDKEYRVMHYFSKSIKGEKTIPVEEVLKVRQGSSLDDKEYKRLSKLLPVGDGKSEAFYTLLLEKEFQPFTDKFPDSEFKSEVKGFIETLEKEKALVAAGSVKHRGKFITNEDIGDTRFDYNAETIRDKVNESLDEKKILNALRAYEGFREGYFQSRAFVKTAKRVNDTLLSLKTLLERKAANPEEEPDESFYKTLSYNDAKRVKKEVQDKKKRLTDKIKADTNNKETWVTIDFSSPSSMNNAVKLIDERLKELEQWGESEKVDGGELFATAYRAIENEDVEGANIAIEKFLAIKPPQDLIKSLKNGVASLEKELEEREVAAEEEAKASAQKKMDDEKAKEANGEQGKEAEATKDDKLGKVEKVEKELVPAAE